MNIFNIILFVVGLCGFLPLLIILYKRKRVKNILRTGLQAKARVYNIGRIVSPPTDIVFYSFYAANRTESYTGKLTTRRGMYQINDVLDIYYLPQNPKRNSMDGAWKSGGILVFGVVIAVFVLFAVYKLYRMFYYGEME
ncbi:MAG: DUF3592 domain-containing protein [Aquaticitalea sp.]